MVVLRYQSLSLIKMIRELINFANSLDEDFKNLGSLPKEGLHILLRSIIDEHGARQVDLDNFRYEQFSKKQKSAPSEFLERCKALHQNAWCIDTNKCFDLPIKAIHTCSPYVVGFKREHLEGGAKFELNKGKKRQVYERFKDYFSKAFTLFQDEDDKEKYSFFKEFFVNDRFSTVLTRIDEEQQAKRHSVVEKIEQYKEQLKDTNDKVQKETLKEALAGLEQELLSTKPLDDASYIIFYLDLPLDSYQAVHKKYLDDKLFNTDKYNTKPSSEGLIYGTSNFLNGYNANMPFLMHQTASFDISGRISNVEAKLLNDLKNMFPNKTLPNPLPIFVYKEELWQGRVIGIFKESGFKFGYQEIIQKLIEDYQQDLSNYYLLFWQNSKEGVVFRDFDFVSRFEYSIKQPIAFKNLFNIKEKGEKGDKMYHPIKTIFDLEKQVLKPLIQNKYLNVDYFGDISKDNYSSLDRTFSSYCKYRKAVYDFVYKSQRSAISGKMFDEMVFNSIFDAVKANNDYGIKLKLNIWYNLYEFFNPKYKINMVNKLKEYQDFVAAIIAEEPVADSSDEKFAFAAGQVIEYIFSKSKSADSSYSFLEPYMQQSRCVEFKKAISNDFARYKHENYSKNFEKVAAFVLSYETNANLKHLMPQILSGVFAKNQLFSTKSLNEN